MGENNHRLADLQLAIMHVLWDQGEATVNAVREALAEDRPLAYDGRHDARQNGSQGACNSPRRRESQCLQALPGT